MSSGYLVVTGANGQLGSFLARYPELQGYPRLLLYHRRQDRLNGLNDGPDQLVRACDLLTSRELDVVLKEANAHFNSLPSRLVHTAAVRSSDAMSVADSDPQVFAATVDQNLTAAYNILRAMLGFCREQQFGRLVFMGSSVTATGLANGAAYAAAKAAIVNLVKSAALENAAYNILINCISPAPVETELSEDYSGDYLAFRKQYFEARLAKTPTGKLVSKQELASLCVLLLDNALQNLTGQEIIVNGGTL